jgi:hypothetical protein
MQRVVDASIEPRMVPTRTESDEVCFVLNVIHLGVVKRLVSFEVVANTAILGI